MLANVVVKICVRRRRRGSCGIYRRNEYCRHRRHCRSSKGAGRPPVSSFRFYLFRLGRETTEKCTETIKKQPYPASVKFNDAVTGHVWLYRPCVWTAGVILRGRLTWGIRPVRPPAEYASGTGFWTVAKNKMNPDKVRHC